MMWRRSTDCDSSACVEVSSCDSNTCVEISFHSASDSFSCVEVGACACGDGSVLVRDSKDPGGPVLRFTGPEWDVFLAGAKAGQFDRAPRT